MYFPATTHTTQNIKFQQFIKPQQLHHITTIQFNRDSQGTMLVPMKRVRPGTDSQSMILPSPARPVQNPSFFGFYFYPGHFTYIQTRAEYDSGEAR
jgi:hypothetical protein